MVAVILLWAFWFTWSIVGLIVGLIRTNKKQKKGEEVKFNNFPSIVGLVFTILVFPLLFVSMHVKSTKTTYEVSDFVKEVSVQEYVEYLNKENTYSIHTEAHKILKEREEYGEVYMYGKSSMYILNGDASTSIAIIPETTLDRIGVYILTEIHSKTDYKKMIQEKRIY